MPLQSAFQTYTKLEKWNGASWEEVKGFFGGSLSRRANAASVLQLTFPDWWKRSLELVYGQKVRFTFALNGLPSRRSFLGRVTDRAHQESDGQSWVSFECMDFLELASKTPVRLTEDGTNYDGYDAGVALKAVFDGLPGAPLDTKGVSGTSPARFVKPTDGLYFPEWTNALEVANRLNELCWDDTAYPSYSLPYFFWQDGEGILNHKKAQPLTATPARTLSRGNAIFKGDVRSRSAHMVNDSAVAGGKDPLGNPVQARYTDTPKANSYGARGETQTRSELTSSEDCRQWAMRRVSQRSQMSEVCKVDSTLGYCLIPGDVAELVDLVRAGSVRMRVLQVDIRFNPADVSCEVGLGDTDYLATEYV